jgi:hypothetical protein
MYWWIFQPGVIGYRDWWEIVMDEVGYPALVAAFGLALGASLELARRTPKTAGSAEIRERFCDV